MTDMLFIRQVPRYLYARYDVVRTRRCINYWITLGLLVGDIVVFLKTEKTRDGELYTRKPWVDKFIEAYSRRKRA
ncbi:hypothetical protein LCGC14_2617800 [marine sediment metagenome]|uniref:Uncharacterized protein n=1 Tax=marine sediment metagenome TaxID=412755 RepID=A0A0F9ARM0_9ZZZZ